MTARIAALGACLLVLAGCATLPDVPHDRPRTAALSQTETQTTPLGRAVATLPDADLQRTAVLALDDGRDAFVARALLADEATRSLDLQYYIWNDDLTGGLMLESLWRAAARGVRVRLLIDDNNGSGLDELLALLDRQPNIEVRLFNPFAHRSFRLLDFLGNFDLANRRMHNKAFIADGQLAVIGGRNIGDEYFGASGAASFADLDLMLAGKLLPEVSASFDSYWNNALAYDVSELLPHAVSNAAELLEAYFASLHADARTAAYLAAVRRSPLIRELKSGALPVEWTNARLVVDSPDKVLGGEAIESTRAHVRRAVGRAEHSLDLVSAYFVPTRSGTEALAALRNDGVRVRVLTNSLAATDVVAVHAGYARWRLDLLRAGVEMFELKAENAEVPAKKLKPARADDDSDGSNPARISGSSERGLFRSGGGSSASLHAKTIGVDGQRIYVGSFNLDPRSARLNTELGVVVESERLTNRLANAFETVIPQRAYQLRLADDQKSEIEWIDRSAHGDQVLTTEPESSLWRRLTVKLLSLLPIDSLL